MLPNRHGLHARLVDVDRVKITSPTAGAVSDRLPPITPRRKMLPRIEHASIKLNLMNICVDSSKVERPVQPDGGGSNPTSTLQLRKRDWSVASVDQDIASQLVAAEHYAKGASNTATYLHGLFPRGWHWFSECVGVAWWIPPTKSAAKAWAGDRWQGVLALSRLAIMPNVPKNAATFLLSKSVRTIDRKRWHTLVSYADKWREHTGAIYLAAGWEYCGETKPEAVYTLNGRMIARKAGPRTRTHAEMIVMGCRFEGRFPKLRFCLRSSEHSADQ